MKSQTVHGAEDLLLLSMMVANKLRETRGVKVSPTSGDYSVHPGSGKTYGHNELRVALSPAVGLHVHIADVWRSDEPKELSTLVRIAADLSDAVRKIDEDASEIRALLREVKAVAKREIAKANRRGLLYKLIKVEPTPLRIDHSDGIGIEVHFESLSPSLMEQHSVFVVNNAYELKEAFAEIVADQSRRAYLRADLDQKGATGMIDGVVLNALRQSGVDVASVLAGLGASRDWILDVSAGDRNFRLYWKEGTVLANIRLDDQTSWK